MRRLAAATLAAVSLTGLTLAGTLPSYADSVDLSANGTQSLTVPDGGSASFSVRLVPETGNSGTDVTGCNATAEAPVTITFTTDDDWASTNPASIEISDCTTEHTVTALVRAGTATETRGANTKITGTATGGQTETRVVEIKGGKDTQTVTVDPTYSSDFVTLHVPATGTSTPTNAAPSVSSSATDPTGVEGDTLSTGGAFTDDGGVGNLTITAAGDEAARVVDNGDGTWSWSYPTTDNGTGTVTVTATDGGLLTATDTFTWTAINAAPVLGTVAGTRAGACTVNLSASFTDVGVADTHTATIAWGEGAGVAPEEATVTETAGTGAGTVSGQHTYAAASSYTATLTVTDDDGGYDTGSTGFTAYNTPSQILAPINVNGTRSSFKIGSTIPVKITVTGCDNGPVSSLTPQVNLVKGDSTPDFPVNEDVYAGSATNGKLMRWDATSQQYIYNLSTKLSQFTGGALVTGTYTVAVNDPSFAEPVKATFDLRK